MEEEPLHKMVLKNDYVEIMHVKIPPGKNSLWHTHSNPRMAVFLSDSTVREDLPGGEPVRERVTHTGVISTPESAKYPFTHRIGNVGGTAFEVIDIEILKHSGVLKARPAKWELAPGASSSMHTHAGHYLIIAATPMQLLMKGPEGASMEHPVKAGDFHWVDSSVTHMLTNKGQKPGIIVEVEIR